MFVADLSLDLFLTSLISTFNGLSNMPCSGSQWVFKCLQKSWEKLPTHRSSFEILERYSPTGYCARHLSLAQVGEGKWKTCEKEYAPEIPRRKKIKKKQTRATSKNDVCLRNLIDDHCNACRRIKFRRKQCLHWPVHSMIDYLIDHLWLKHTLTHPKYV